MKIFVASFLLLAAVDLASGTCGIPGRIAGGQQVDIMDFPWQAALYKSGSFFCGGAVYNENFIVTAGHCAVYAMEAASVQVSVGSNYKYASSNDYRSVIAIFKHPNFNINSLQNDIALLKLATSLTFSPTIQPICMPSATRSDADLEVRKGNITGWGSLGSGTLSNIHFNGEKVVFKNSATCSAAHGGAYNSHTMICASEDGVNSCQGDSGGPLAWLNTGTEAFDLVGIVSWGYGCVPPRNVSVYTRVSNYVEWISSTVAAGSG